MAHLREVNLKDLHHHITRRLYAGKATEQNAFLDNRRKHFILGCDDFRNFSIAVESHSADKFNIYFSSLHELRSIKGIIDSGNTLPVQRFSMVFGGLTIKFIPRYNLDIASADGCVHTIQYTEGVPNFPRRTFEDFVNHLRVDYGANIADSVFNNSWCVELEISKGETLSLISPSKPETNLPEFLDILVYVAATNHFF